MVEEKEGRLMYLFNWILKTLRQWKPKNLPNTPPNPDFSEIRDKITLPTREINPVRNIKKKSSDIIVSNGVKSSEISHPKPTHFEPAQPEPDQPEPDLCPYCSSKNIVRRGIRKKKYETQQRYLCNACRRSFVPQMVKGKSFPLKVILDGLSFYNTGYTLLESCKFLKENYGMEVKDSTLSEWVKEFEPLCRYSRLRPYGLKLFSPAQVIHTAHLYHHQVYDFSVHRGKLGLLLQEYKYGKFDNLREFLEAIQLECPHQFFKDGLRASEQKIDFSLDKVIVREKQNFATRLAKLLLQAVSDNKLRHKALQDFMLRNDSVTVAVEVPVYMDNMDVEHMQEELRFKIPLKLDKVLTGHIDILQLRNGAVHILDYKPQEKDKRRLKPVTQLTLYALMLSRLTGLRLYDFKCALAL
jgi:transposase-like protein